LREQFELGLFENPYVDSDVAEATVGRDEFQAAADIAQRRSIVLLRNEDDFLPLPVPDERRRVHVYTLGIDAATMRSYGYRVTAGDANAEANSRPPPDTDIALIRITVTNPTVSLADFPDEPQPVPGLQPGLRPATIFGGAGPNELDFIAFSDMVGKQSWQMSPSLAQITATIEAVGASNTVLAIYFRQPYVIDAASGLRDAGAIVALFGADDGALMDVLTGRFEPSGRLPFALANSAQAIVRQAPDAPGYPEEDTLYPFGFGLNYGP
jgi:beta-glucosidase